MMKETNEITEWYYEKRKEVKWQKELLEPRKRLSEKIAKAILDFIKEGLKRMEKAGIDEKKGDGQVIVFLLDTVEDVVNELTENEFIGFCIDLLEGEQSGDKNTTSLRRYYRGFNRDRWLLDTD